MKIENLRLQNVRNYTKLDLEFPSGVIVFVGDNGQGKTNLIEAFHYLLRGESFRPATLSSIQCHNPNQGHANLAIRAKINQNNLLNDVELRVDNDKKTLLCNGHRVSTATLERRFPLVLFSPESLAAIKSGAEERRALIDDVLITHSASSVKVLRDFRKALRTRNKVLRDLRDGLTKKNQAMAVLESLDPIFLPLASELTVTRLKALDDLQSEFQKACQFVLQDSYVDISVEYLISGQNARGWERSEILSALHNRALELRESEVSSGTSLVGPHRHDVRFLFTGKDSRFFCSQGQQRALILSFKMAQILYHYKAHQIYPFLLLDDVLSELDPVRRANLVRFLKDIPAQIFLTTTDLSFSTDFGDRRLTVFQIARGIVKRAPSLTLEV